MVVDPNEFIPFSEWLSNAAGGFIVLALVIFVAWMIIAFAFTAIRNTPQQAISIVGGGLKRAILEDFPRSSVRRTIGMTRLAIQEAIRNKVLIIFALFVVLLLFAGWFLDVQNDHPARLYLGFVISTSTYLLLALAMFVSAFSIPNDIKNKTIYTITTKPVRAHEIFLGRVLGFAVVGTILLLLMGLVSYAFVVRGLDHSHTIDIASIEWDEETGLGTGVTSVDSHHRHDFLINRNIEGDQAVGVTEVAQGHTHAIFRDGDNFVLGPPVGDLLARVPVYGSLRFLDRYGRESDAGGEGGLSVGKEWTYREYIEGNTLSTAIWTFENLTSDMFSIGAGDEGIVPLELNLRVFRTTKGDIEGKVRGEVLLVNPEKTLSVQDRYSAPIPFEAEEFQTFQINIDYNEIRRQNPNTAELEKIDLFQDLIDNGKLEVHVRCRDHAQFFGMAQADMYIRAPEGSFEMNFFKCYLGIWMQLILVTLFGVFFSTFLNGIVALVATLSIVVMGVSAGFIAEVQSGDAPGGGPIESLIRNITQQGATVDLDMGETATSVIQSLDSLYLDTMESVAKLAPDFPRFNMAAKVAYGYDINLDLILKQITTTLVYFFVLLFAGYFIISSREIAA
ncbi:MAG: hypothetical protein CMJ76_14095 [Planctomycetaceae bacterium]|nr:hypothetical protein [Planctomycetaceae bacterium]|tara:strand:+ start:328 stop:2184 length:1857 start_codon:yes stop_codon:yes gene_type:complete